MMNEQTRQKMRDQRTYHVSDERLREFAKLSHEQRLTWVEQCSTFVRLGQMALAEQMGEDSQRATWAEQDGCV